MTDKKSPQDKNKTPASDNVGGKKPHATLDLKATEVKAAAGTGNTKPTPGKTEADKAKGPATASTSSASATGAKAPGGPAFGGKPGDGKPTASSKQPDVKAAAKDMAPDAKNKAPDAKPKEAASASRAATPPPPARSGSGIGSFFSHALAGIIGGFLVLLGADALQPQFAELKSRLGLSEAAQKAEDGFNKLENRLAALEKDQAAQAKIDTEEITKKITAAEASLGELKTLKDAIGTLQQSQEKLGQSTAELAKAVNEKPEAGAIPEERLAKLEQQLSTMTAFAESNENSGIVPRLAALTGRMADLEETLKTQIAAVRSGVSQNVETRLSSIAESTEAARSGTQRMDRQLAGVTNDTARLGQQMQTLKADTTRLGDTLRVVQEETGKISSKLDGLAGDVNAKIAKLASPSDVNSAVKPVAEQVASLQSRVANVVSAESDRKQNAKRIVLSLELANLERAIERGDSFAPELAQVKATAGGLIDVTALERFGEAGVAPVSKLQALFRPVAHQIIEASAAPAGGSVFDQLLANARSVVKVRKVSHEASDTSAEATVSRIESALAAGRLSKVVSLTKDLPDGGRKAAQGWLQKVENRHAVDVALAAIEDQLKASLSGTN
jgi:hypothetical protein